MNGDLWLILIQVVALLKVLSYIFTKKSKVKYHLRVDIIVVNIRKNGRTRNNKMRLGHKYMSQPHLLKWQ